MVIIIIIMIVITTAIFINLIKAGVISKNTKLENISNVFFALGYLIVIFNMHHNCVSNFKIESSEIRNGKIENILPQSDEKVSWNTYLEWKNTILWLQNLKKFSFVSLL